MKIAFLCSRFPLPKDKGDKLRAYHLIKEMAAYHNIYLLAITETDIDALKLTAMSEFAEIDHYPLPVQKRYSNSLGALTSDWPLQSQYFYDKNIKTAITQRLEEIRPDHVIVQLIRMAPYAMDLPYPKSIDLMDSMSLNNHENMPSIFRLLRPLASLERRRIKRYERKVLEHFRQSFIISTRDKAEFDIPEGHTMSVIPNGVDTHYFNTSQPMTPSYDLLFCGNLGYIHNHRAANYLIDEIMRMLPASVKLLIGGARASKWLFIKQKPNITVMGWTEDIRDYYRSSRIMVAPIFTGSGMQNKILEAMSIGLPCITTPFVNESIGAEEGTEILLADTPKQFVQHIESLLQNPHLYQAISLRSRKFVIDKYRWRDSAMDMLSCIE